jgi:hypothetical protein
LPHRYKLEKEKPSLPFYERLFALGVVGFFLFMIGLNSYLSDGGLPKETGEPRFISNPLIEVNIEGKVKRPGTYQVRKGSSLRELVELAEPDEDANLKRMKLDSPITRRRKLVIR